MTAGSNVVKITAKTALKNNWLKCIAACCVYLFGHFACQFSASLLSIPFGDSVTYVIYFASLFFLLFPLLIGLIRYFWRMIMGADDSPISVFNYFLSSQLYLKALRLIFSITARVALIALIVLLPAIAVWLFSNPVVYETFDVAIPIWSSNLNSIGLLLSTVSLLVIISLSIKYYLAIILFVADENMEVDEAIHMSKIISKNTQFDFIFLGFSLLGWILLSLLVIPLVFTMPYIITCFAVHCRFAIADYNIFVENQNKTNFGYFGNYGNEI